MAILQLAKKSKASEAAIISTRKIWLLFFIVIKIKEKKKVSVQEQCLLLLRILPKFWSRFQLASKQRLIFF
jgi:hypothetical protein